MVNLTAIAFGLLFELLVNAGPMLTNEQILQRVWGKIRAGNARVIRSSLMRLHRMLCEDAASPEGIFAEPRVGNRIAKGETPDGEDTSSRRLSVIPSQLEILRILSRRSCLHADAKTISRLRTTWLSTPAARPLLYEGMRSSRIAPLGSGGLRHRT